MTLHCTFTCSLPNGLHARPATALEHVVRGFASEVTLVSERTGASANAKSVLGIVGLDIRHGDVCRVTIEGVDEPEASAAVARFLERDLAHCDDAIPPAPVRPGERPLPRMLLQADGGILHGTPMVPGIGHGRALVIDGFAIPDVLARARTDDPDAELARLEAGLHALDARYEEELAEDGPDVAASIIRAHHAIARDPALHDHLEMSVRKRHLTVAGAIAAADAFFSGMLAASESALLRERALDVGDVCRELFEVIHGTTKVSARARLSADTVCIAENLTPREFLALDRKFLKGLVLEFAASTSHTIVLARSFGIPTLTGVTGLRTATLRDRDVIIDADLGVLITAGNAGTHRYYEMEQARLAGRRAQLRHAATTRAETRDGQAVEIGANIATGEETVAAILEGADGIGLFRTEMLFLNRDDPPSEDEQFEEYRRALIAAAGRPVIIRTLDIGGDKPVPYLRMPHEENPYLGYRAVRMYHEFETLVRTQVRALVRASAFGDLRVMVPMISRLEEARFMRQVVAEEQARCTQDGHVFAPLMQLGAMVEVPSMAFQLDHFCEALDFFSIGTNDLLQYFGAVDRGNDKVAHLHDALSPAFLRLLKKIVDDIHAAGLWVGMCGELAGNAAALPLLVGLGLDELSMAAPRVAEAKAGVRALAAAPCQALLHAALACASVQDVSRLVDAFDGWQPVPLTAPELVVIDADCATREEAIKAVVDRLYVMGRTDQPREVESAVWQREGVYSTAFGHGFAIPHCQSDALKANSLVILRTRQPVAWESLDGEPVSVLVLLAIRESDHAVEHLKILATLARKVMRAGFRERLMNEQDPAVLCRYVMECVGE